MERLLQTRTNVMSSYKNTLRKEVTNNNEHMSLDELELEGFLTNNNCLIREEVPDVAIQSENIKDICCSQSPYFFLYPKTQTRYISVCQMHIPGNIHRRGSL